MSLSTGAALVLSVAVAFCAKRILDLNERIQALESEKRKPDEPKDLAYGKSKHAEIVAAITAAVIASYGNKARIVTVTPSAEKAGSWSLEGRRSIFHSHKVR